MDENEVLGLLVSGSYISGEDAKKAAEFAKSRSVPAIDYLLAEGFITKELLGQALAEFYKVPYANLERYPPSPEQVLLIPEEKAAKYTALVFSELPSVVRVATSDPTQKGLITELEKKFKPKKVELAYAPVDDIKPLFIYYRKPLETRFSSIVTAQKRVAPEILDAVITDSLAFKASDIHIEPQAEDVIVRFRIDGVLYEAGHLPKEQYAGIVNHVKVRTHMRIDEHFAAQDGAMRYGANGDTVDLRVSVVPTLDGERIAIRILSRYVRRFNLSELGLSLDDQKLLLDSSQKPFGMILAVGPTGSGKTTTLYALIRGFNRPDVNIMTIEDPVEYKVAGLNQIQVNPQTNLTFAKGLKSIIRQDPNIILVGEIRDQETAEIAVNAALTGHLLLSTFHSNDAASAIPRLLNIGIEPFLLSSTLELIVAQRLVRKICPKCRYTAADTEAGVKKLLPEALQKTSPQPTAIYKGKGCDVCNHTGYHGRTALFELIKVTAEMHDLILKSPSTREIWGLAKKQGSRSLFEDGIRKVENGVTTIEELMRVAPVS